MCKTYHLGEHVQFKFRSGTRAGFVRRVCKSPEDADLDDVAVGKGALAKATKSNPVYLIEIEKNGDFYVKTGAQISTVKGDGSLSEDEIVEKDKKIKGKKVSGKRKAMDAEPAANKESKRRAMRSTPKRSRAK